MVFSPFASLFRLVFVTRESNPSQTLALLSEGCGQKVMVLQVKHVRLLADSQPVDAIGKRLQHDLPRESQALPIRES